MSAHQGRRIVLPVHHFPPRYNAGAENLTLWLAQGLMRLGFDAEVVALESISSGRTDAVHAEHDIHAGVPVWRLSMNLLDAPDRLRMNYDNHVLGAWFEGYFARTRPDLVHFQAGYLLGMRPIVTAMRQGIPTVLTLHDYWFACPRHTLLRGDGALCAELPAEPGACAWCLKVTGTPLRFVQQIFGESVSRFVEPVAAGVGAELIQQRRMLAQEVLREVDAVICPSEFVRSRFGSLLNPDKTHLLRYVIDVGSCQGSAEGRDPSVFRVGYFGQIAQHKGIHLLVEAFRQLSSSRKSMELHIYGGPVGDDPYGARLLAAAREDGRITLHGRYRNADFAALASALDVCVVPSIWYEVTGIVALEALASGTPVLAARIGGLAEVVNEGIDGLHFAARDTGDLASKLQRLIDDPELLGALQRGSRNRPVPRIEDYVARHTAIYESVIASKRAQLIPSQSDALLASALAGATS